jgi:uncharacterized membrane protein YgcG
MSRMIPFGVALVLAAALPGRAQTTESGVRDRAGLFSAAAAREAERSLREVQAESGWRVIIETVETLGGQPALDRATATAKSQNLSGLYVLIARKEHKVQAVPSPSARAAFTGPKVDRITAAVTAAFKAQEFDRGLRDAVALIRQDAQAQPDARAARPAGPSGPRGSRVPTSDSGVTDRAGLFSAEEVGRAEKALLDVERDRGWQVVIETVETLGGQAVKDMAIAKANARGTRGLYVLIARDDHKVWVQPSAEG